MATGRACRESNQLTQLRQELEEVGDDIETLTPTKDSSNDAQVIRRTVVEGLQDSLEKKKQQLKSAEEKAANLQVELDNVMTAKNELVRDWENMV